MIKGKGYTQATLKRVWRKFGHDPFTLQSAKIRPERNGFLYRARNYGLIEQGNDGTWKVRTEVKDLVAEYNRHTFLAKQKSAQTARAGVGRGYKRGPYNKREHNAGRTTGPEVYVGENATVIPYAVVRGQQFYEVRVGDITIIGPRYMTVPYRERGDDGETTK